MRCRDSCQRSASCCKVHPSARSRMIAWRLAVFWLFIFSHADFGFMLAAVSIVLDTIQDADG